MIGWPSASDAPTLAEEGVAAAVAGLRPVAAARPLVQYQRRPLAFCEEVLHVPRHTLVWSENDGYARHRWDGTPDPLAALLDGLANGEDVGVESATGTGKSYTAACAVLWFLACWQGARVFTFAPKEDQLRLFIWAEMSKLWPAFQTRFPSAELTDLRIRMTGDDTWGAWGYAVGVKANEQVATKAAGMHAPHMLLINEETPGIAMPVIEAQRNTVTGEHNLRLSIGNPDDQQDALHQFCTEPGVRHIRISATDHPNVVLGQEMIPGAVTRKSVAARRATYGEGSRMYDSRVRGISPAEAADALIKAEWIDAAMARYNDPAFRVGPRALGVDVANSEAGDEAAIARGLGACLLEVPTFPCPDANVLGADVVAEAEADGIDAQYIGVDSVGVGAGTVNEAKRLGYLVKALNGGERAWGTVDEDQDVKHGQRKVPNAERFANLRAQMGWQLREDLQHNRIALPPVPTLKQDLLTPRWWTHGGKIFMEPKEDIKKRLPSGRSPNEGDATMYWNWVRDRTVEKPEPPDPRPFDPDVLEAEVQAKYTMQGRRARQRRNTPRITDTW